jgi:ATP-dependent protease Clp ATPase subunit
LRIKKSKGHGFSVASNGDFVDSTTRSSINLGFMVSYKSKSEYYSRGSIMSSIKRIFIIGHSGAGKGVLAQAVAKKLGWKFINADVLGCAAHIGRTVYEQVASFSLSSDDGDIEAHASSIVKAMTK